MGGWVGGGHLGSQLKLELELGLSLAITEAVHLCVRTLKPFLDHASTPKKAEFGQKVSNFFGCVIIASDWSFFVNLSNMTKQLLLDSLP